ncbi:MAG TPA: CrcB family protein [Polyangia bacterium]|jgi:CrcB protein|nr:CrcB family protein [Polyangia bacterium]
MRFALICLGGAAGTGARFLLGGWAARVFGPAFPYGTLIVNVTGSFLAVVIMGLSIHRGLFSEDLRFVLVSGVMGGFTTYSAFNYETLSLFNAGSPGLAALNIAATVLGCLVAGGLALLLMRLVP